MIYNKRPNIFALLNGNVRMSFQYASSALGAIQVYQNVKSGIVHIGPYNECTIGIARLLPRSEANELPSREPALQLATLVRLARNQSRYCKLIPRANTISPKIIQVKKYIAIIINNNMHLEKLTLTRTRCDTQQWSIYIKIKIKAKINWRYRNILLLSFTPALRKCQLRYIKKKIIIKINNNIMSKLLLNT